MMKNLKLLCLLLAMVMVLGLLAGCGSQESAETPTQAKPDIGDFSDANASLDIIPEATEEIPTAYELQGLSAEKLGTVDAYRIDSCNDNGFVYLDNNGICGIKTWDCSGDTGAIYSHCQAKDYYFLYSNTTPDISNMATMNCYGVVDVTGKELVPAQYASIQILNERYIRVCEVTAQTTNQDEALVFYSDSAFAIFADEDDTFFKGNWYVYDTTTCQKLEGVSGTKAVSVSARGNFVTFYNDNSERLVVNDKGQLLPENGHLFDNGCYKIEDGDNGVFYDADGNALFTYKIDDYAPRSIEGDYICVSKYVDNDTCYALMDYKGNIISSEFPEHIYVYGNLIQSQEVIYDFGGNVIFEDPTKTVTFDETHGKALFLRGDNASTMISPDGNVLMQVVEDDVFNVFRSDFVAYKDTEDGDFYYSFKDNDYTIEGYSFGSWLVKGYDEASGTYNIIDTITGETILSGYNNYGYHSVPGVGTYVYARTSEGVYDIYLVK